MIGHHDPSNHSSTHNIDPHIGHVYENCHMEGEKNEAGTFIVIKPTVLPTQDIFLGFKFCL